MHKVLSLFVFSLFSLALWATPSLAEEVVGKAHEWQLGFQPPATPVMEQLEWLHDNYLLYIITAVTIFVLGLLTVIVLKFNRRANPVPSKFTHNTMIEIVWTVIPVMILVAIAIPSLRIHYFMDRAEKPEMTLKVTGFQWYWGYEYPDQGGFTYESYRKEDKDLVKGDTRLLSTDKPVVVPVNTTVRLLITGSDVIHSWAIPSFGVKIDAVPGRLNETWFRVKRPGIYYGQCSELCGVGHGFMPIEVHAVEKDVFNAWVERAKTGDYKLAGLMNPQEPVSNESSPAKVEK